MLYDNSMNNSKHLEYSFWVKLASTSAVVAALLMLLVKTYAWALTDSASVLATLADSVFDIAASLINLFVLRYSLTPADNEHRFGHGKAESLAGLMQAAFIIGSAILLIFHSVGRLSHPTRITNLDVGYSAILVTLVITLILVTIQSLALRKTNSVAIKADSLHYKGDILMNLGVLFALVLNQQGIVTIDAWVAVAIACYLMFGAVQIGRESLDSLMDKELPDDVHAQVLALAKGVELVNGVHDLRTRQAGGTIFIQLHLELDDDLSLLQAHQIGDKVEALLTEFKPNADVLIHLDPMSVVSSPKDPITFTN